MGLKNFARVHVQAYAADDMIQELADLNVDLKAKLDREHNKRVREKANAKVASAGARSKAAIELADTRADFSVAVAAAEARGAARGEAIGYERAMKETELFDAGFKGGKQQGRDKATRKQAQSNSFRHSPAEMPPASSQDNAFGFEEPFPSRAPSIRLGDASSHRASNHSGPSSRSRNLAGGSHSPANFSSGSRRPSVHDSNIGSVHSKDSGVKHSQYESSSDKRSFRGSKASVSHGRKSVVEQSQQVASSRISRSRDYDVTCPRNGTFSQDGGSHNGRADSQANPARSMSFAASSNRQSNGSGTIRPGFPQPRINRSMHSHSAAMNSNSAPRAPLSSFAHSSIHPSSSASQVSSQRRSQLRRHVDALYGDESDDCDSSSEHDDGRGHGFDHGFRGRPY